MLFSMRQVMRSAPETAVLGIGVSVPGLVRSVDGLVPFAPNLGWTDVHFVDLLAETNGVRSILVDTSTDLRQQALTHNLTRVDAILFTHSHADHIMGLDEVRRFNVMQKTAMPCDGDAQTLADL